MDSFTTQYPPPDRGGRKLQHRTSTDMRPLTSAGFMSVTEGNGPVPVPNGMRNNKGNGFPPNMRGTNRGRVFDGPRSPPGNKNTSHVPCKFFRQGACQAGKACPFLHSTEPFIETAPCKYFAKGNCKFGAKCALAHILPDGRRVNRPQVGVGGGQMNQFGKVNPPHYQDQATSTLLSMQTSANPGYPSTFPYGPQDDYLPPQPPQTTQHGDIPTIDTTFSSNPGSAYGSPPYDSRLLTSPNIRGLSVMDAPLPASFDSQGISHIARYGAIAASVPSRFGVDPLSPSLPQAALSPSSTLRDLHDSAFGEIPSSKNLNTLASSPPAANGFAVGKRMHSERSYKPKLISSSLGARPLLGIGDEWDGGTFAFDEDPSDMVPTSLHDLLTPQERMRRSSRAEEDITNAHHRQLFSNLSTPAESKVGSPLASSPSRFGALFSRQIVKPDIDTPSSFGGSAFGHVGSPLRNSTLHPDVSPSLRPISRPVSGDVSPFVSSPPRQSSMSILSQQLQRTRLSARADSADTLHPGLARHPSDRMLSPGSAATATGTINARPDRVVSNGSIGRTEKIDEEQGLFSMEEEEEDKEKRREDGGAGRKRYSGGLGWGFSKGKNSPVLGPIGRQKVMSEERDGVSPRNG